MSEVTLFVVVFVLAILSTVFAAISYSNGYNRGKRNSLGIPFPVQNLPCHVTFKLVARVVGHSNLIVLKCKKLWGPEERIVDTGWISFPEDERTSFYLTYNDGGSLIALKSDVPEIELEEEPSARW